MVGCVSVVVEWKEARQADGAKQGWRKKRVVLHVVLVLPRQQQAHISIRERRVSQSRSSATTEYYTWLFVHRVSSALNPSAFSVGTGEHI